MQVRSRTVARGFKSGDWPDLPAATPPLEALRHSQLQQTMGKTFAIMHIGVSRAHVHAMAQKPMLVRSPADDLIKMLEHLDC